ncbi:hypothetical protein J2R98_002319 [Alkalibacillus filiformis]|uniref:Uncharacterized protein n=1 Tax=Alkalibacillus filiformis TaxID=200990 RepID=A0ABU0DVU3_9BACI|nr:hypothetical protein [Alkalibacillus filiformis]MDQ0352475.1 hypothetical protein [Alkalibacillus filiformis]
MQKSLSLLSTGLVGVKLIESKDKATRVHNLLLSASIGHQYWQSEDEHYFVFKKREDALTMIEGEVSASALGVKLTPVDRLPDVNVHLVHGDDHLDYLPKALQPAYQTFKSFKFNPLVMNMALQLQICTES